MTESVGPLQKRILAERGKKQSPPWLSPLEGPEGILRPLPPQKGSAEQLLSTISVERGGLQVLAESPEQRARAATQALQKPDWSSEQGSALAASTTRTTPEASQLEALEALQEALRQESQLLQGLEQSRAQIRSQADGRREALAQLAEEEAQLTKLVEAQRQELAAAQAEREKLRASLEAEEAHCSKLTGRLQLKSQMAGQLRQCLTQRPEPARDSPAMSRLDASACESELIHLLGQSLKCLDAGDSSGVPSELRDLCARLRLSAGRFREESAAWLGEMRQQLGMSTELERNRSTPSAQTLILTLVDTLKGHLQSLPGAAQTYPASDMPSIPEPAKPPKLSSYKAATKQPPAPTEVFPDTPMRAVEDFGLGERRSGSITDQTEQLLRQQEQELTACLDKLRGGPTTAFTAHQSFSFDLCLCIYSLVSARKRT